MEKITPLSSKIDKSFDASNTLNYDLVFQVTDRTCAYSVLDRAKNRFIALESYDNPLPAVVAQSQWMKNPFRSVRVVLENNRSALVPSVLFEESEKETYLNFSLEPEGDEKICHDNLTWIEVVNIFGVRKNLCDEIERLFPDARICHLTSFLIESIWLNFKNLIKDNRIFIYLRDKDFNLLIFEKKQLVYSNAFHFKAPEDVVYFVIFVMEQLNLNPEEVPVTLLGNINTDSPCFEFLFRYIRNIDFAGRSESYNYSYVFNDIPGHSFYPLLNPVM